MKAIYTDVAKSELEEFLVRQQEMLETVVAERKLVLGDDVLEITASDIKAASSLIQINRPVFRRYRSTELVTRLYIAMGVAMMVGGIFYPRLEEIYDTNRTQALVFITGAAMATIGWFTSYWVNARRWRSVEDLDSYAVKQHKLALDLQDILAKSAKIEVVNTRQQDLLDSSFGDKR
jgi:VIT1/CCC1 family predicted Fe2+/Mn2+ transporter